MHDVGIVRGQVRIDVVDHGQGGVPQPDYSSSRTFRIFIWAS